MGLQFVIYCTVLTGITHTAEVDRVQQALEYVYKVKSSNCGLGTGEVLPLQFDVVVWNQYTDPAIRTANLLSKILARNGGTLDTLTDDLFFMMVRNNVHGDSLIFGSAIAIEKGVYSKYGLFCPYAYKKNSTVRSHDISINYNYLRGDTEWYNSVKNKTWDNVTLTTDGISYRLDNASLPEVDEVYPIAGLGDGHWTDPYYDCGGGEVWMVTYSSPIFMLQGGEAYFRGVATIDIELTRIDINQCDTDMDDGPSGLDVFRGTHRCHQTTNCVPLSGYGFVPGAYTCQCKDGYYFPGTVSDTLTPSAYNGFDIETHFRQHGPLGDHNFRCLACATGCDTCVDSSPCLHERSEALMVLLVLLNTATVLGIVVIGFLVYLYRIETVIKSASPIFLELMCVGAIIMCSHFYVEYTGASVLACTVGIWPLHLGFFVMYGSLVLKTWRVSMIFGVGTHKRIHLPDQVLLQRLGIICLLIVGALSTWTVTSPPVVDTLKTSEKLKFYVCNFGSWQYGIIGAEILFLLYGVYLCFTVRKAPAYFNESKHITWAVYNAIILGTFMSLLSSVFVSVLGVNLMVVVQFAQIHVYSTVTLLLIFVPKFQAVVRKIQIEPHNPTVGTMHSQPTLTGRIKKAQVAQLPAVLKVHIGTQTKWE